MLDTATHRLPPGSASRGALEARASLKPRPSARRLFQAGSLLLTLPLCLACTAARAGTWSSLWYTPDQQAQHLLEQHRPADAAKLFTDPRRRAYAELKAGHYLQAAALLKPFQDPVSQYNRGNALARAGQLEDALAAYDAALKQAPGDADIKHNRDLVARALEHQKKPPGQNGQGHGRSRSGQGSQSAGQQGQSAGRSGRQSGRGGSSGQSGHASQQARQAPGQSGSHAGQSGSTQQAGSQKGSQPSASPALARNGRSGSSASSGSDAQQARRDAAAGVQFLHQSASRSSSGNGGRGTQLAHDDLTGKGGNRTPPPKPPTEQSLALDEWLRRIPDDSGELLRRKFLIEHMMREQEEQQQDGSNNP